MAEYTVQIYSASGHFQSRQLPPGGPFSLGRDEQNWLTLHGPDIAPHHLELVYEPAEKKWYARALSPLGVPMLDGFFLPPGDRRELHEHSLLRVGDYELRFFRPPPTLPEQPAPAAALPAGGTPIHPVPVEAVSAASTAAQWFTAKIMRAPEDGVVPGQKAIFDLMLTNNGPRLADFKIKIIGLGFQYQLKLPARIGVNAGESGSVSLVLIPQRSSDTRAGDHRLIFRVEDPDHYPGLWCDCPTMLTILPFQAFEVEKPPFPLNRTVAWYAKKIGFDFHLRNDGNAPARFQLVGQDATEECHLGFTRQSSQNYPSRGEGEERELINGATVTVEAGDRVKYRAWVKPQSFPIFLRKKTLPFSLHVSPQAGGQPAPPLTGKIVQRPLIGWPWLALLALLLLPLCAWLMLWPHIIAFKADGQLNGVVKQENETLSLEWSAWPPGVNLRLEPNLGLVGNERVGNLQVTAVPDQTYEIHAETLLCELTNRYLARLCVVNKTITINVTPIAPRVEPLRVSPSQVTLGQPEKVMVSVDIRDAQVATLLVNGSPRPLATEQYRGDQTIEVAQDTTILVVAQRNSFSVTQEIYIPAVTPTPEPTPVPELGKLIFSDTQLSAGEPLTIDYETTGVEEVLLLPDGIRYPASGTISVTPGGSTNYTLVAVDDQGNQTLLASQQVIVESPTSTPTPTAAPVAPRIVEFLASETDILITTGGNDDDDDERGVVTLSWNVEGETTNIELLNKTGVVIQNNLPNISRLDVPVSEDDTQFVLVAYNNSQESRKPVLLNIDEVAKPIIYSFSATLSNDYKFTSSGCGTTEKNAEHRLVCVITPTATTSPIIFTQPATITFAWQTDNADKVFIDDTDKIQGTQKPEGTALVTYKPSLTSTLDSRGHKFTLIAQNEAGETKRKIRICYWQASLPSECRRD